MRKEIGRDNMIERLQAIETRYQEITEEIMKPENISNVKRH